jgi:hypothetical protein
MGHLAHFLSGKRKETDTQTGISLRNISTYIVLHFDMKVKKFSDFFRTNPAIA